MTMQVPLAAARARLDAEGAAAVEVGERTVTVDDEAGPTPLEHAGEPLH